MVSRLVLFILAFFLCAQANSQAQTSDVKDLQYAKKTLQLRSRQIDSVVTWISSLSTDRMSPTAKAVYDFVVGYVDTAAAGGVGVTDGDKGDIDVTGIGTVWTVDTGAITTIKIAANAVTTTEINNSAVTYAKLQDVSATDRLLGRDAAGAGAVEELTVSNGIAFTGAGGIEVDTTLLATVNDVSVVAADLAAHELADGDLDDTNELQTLTLDSLTTGGVEYYTVGITDGNTVNISVPQPDSWGTQVVESDVTLTGNGTSGTPLKVDTTVIATLNDVAVVAADLAAHELADGDLDDTNELQTLTLDSLTTGGVEYYTVGITDGNSVNISVPQGTVTGTGLSNLVAYWNGTSSLTYDTDFQFNGDQVGIGTGPSASYKLLVRQASTEDGIGVTNSAGTQTMRIFQGGSSVWESNGNMDIKTNGGTIVMAPAGGGGFISGVVLQPLATKTDTFAGSSMLKIGGTYNPSLAAYLDGSPAMLRLSSTFHQDGSANQPYYGAVIEPTLGTVNTDFRGIYYKPSSHTFLWQPDGDTVRSWIGGKLGIGPGAGYSPLPLFVGGTSAIRVPVGTTAQRPTGERGLIRFNSDADILEWHDGSDWQSAGGGGGGGSLTDGDYGDIDVSGTGTVMTVDTNAITDIKVNDVSVSKLTTGDLAAGLVATLPNTSTTFRINYDNDNPALLIDDANNGAAVNSEDGEQYLYADNTKVTIGSGTTKMEYEDGALKLFDSDATQAIVIQPPPTDSLTASWVFTLPQNAGDAGQVLQTDGSGNTSWATPSSGSSPSIISPAQITSDQDDYAPTGWADATIIRLSGDDGIRAITSFSATGVSDGEEKTLVNIGSYPLYIPGEHPDGTASNRVSGLWKDFILFPGTSARIFYDASSTRWRILDGMAKLEDFRTQYYQWSPGSNTSGDWGDWATGTSGGSVSSIAVSASTPGNTVLNTGTGTTGAAFAYFVKSALVDFTYISSAHIFSEFLFQVEHLSDATDSYTAYLSIDPTANSATLNNNSVGVRYSHDVNSGKLEGFSRSNTGTETVVDLGVTVSAGTLYKVRIELDKSNTEARFYVDATMKGRVASTMPTAVAVGSRALMLKSAGTSSRRLFLHAMASGAIY